LKIKIGTRTSNLAMWQATNVQQIVEGNGYETEIVKITSDGDRSVGGDLSSQLGQFTSKVDEKLVKREIDIAVHSSKDVPVEDMEEIVNLAYLSRGSTSDIILFNKKNNDYSLKKLLANNKSTSLSEIFEKIPQGAKLGTSSVRRQAFFLSQRNDILPIAVRGKVETRIKKLISNNVDALILAEAGLKRLESIDCLTDMALELESYRISSEDWPTAPGQGAISVHCLSDRYEEFGNLRILLNDSQTESDVELERKLLFDLGGGCQFPVGMESIQGNINGLIAPNNWRELYSTGKEFTLQKIDNESDLGNLNFTETIDNNDVEFTERKIISTLNSDRLQSSLMNVGIPVNNIPVIKLEMIPENWPEIDIDDSLNKNKWPILILTSPFAAKAANEMIKQIPNLQRMMWLAIGEGTARACFRSGNPASVCSDSRDKDELFKYILENIHTDIPLYIPMSSLSTKKFVNDLEKKNYTVSYWDAYVNTSLKVENVDVNQDDVLLISSPSSAKSWISNNLPIPDNILCMGNLTKTTIEVLDGFKKSEISVLDGPTYNKIVDWWKKETED
tara:strand:+ start:1572 stop:3257 length:1686 start_codon:yes stop_codon:yes gene_type:complete